MSTVAPPEFGQVSSTAWIAWTIVRDGGVWSGRSVWMEACKRAPKTGAKSRYGHPIRRPVPLARDFAVALRDLHAKGFLYHHRPFHFEVR